MQDVKDLLFNVCTLADTAACDFVGRGCDSCSKKQDLELHPYINSLFLIRNLMDRGYPVDKDDFYLETWLDLIVLENAIAKAHEENRNK